MKPKVSADEYKNVCAKRAMKYIFCHLIIIKFLTVLHW